MRFSVVTISYQQAEFLERAIVSVLRQRTAVEVEYIVVDPGSTDGSREIIERYRNQIDHVVLELDEGPADGLNKGFARASGDVFCYLNADDEFEPGAFARAAAFFASSPRTDVVCGHAWIVDRDGGKLRRVWSDPYSRTLVAYGAAIQIQPSTFIRAAAFRRAGGFNVENWISWDAELLFELMSSGARIDTIDAFLSFYRVHPASITGAALYGDLAAEQRSRRFERLMGRPWRPLDRYVKGVMFVVRQLRNPPAFFERLFRGKVYGRGVQAARRSGGIRRCSES